MNSEEDWAGLDISLEERLKADEGGVVDPGEALLESGTRIGKDQMGLKESKSVTQWNPEAGKQLTGDGWLGSGG